MVFISGGTQLAEYGDLGKMGVWGNESPALREKGFLPPDTE